MTPSTITPQAFERITSALRANPPEGRGDIISECTTGPVCCALGTLGLAAGLTERDLWKDNGDSWRRTRVAIKKEFGIGFDLVPAIYRANDDVGPRRPAQERAEAVIEALRPFVSPEVEPEIAPPEPSWLIKFLRRILDR